MASEQSAPVDIHSKVVDDSNSKSTYVAAAAGSNPIPKHDNIFSHTHLTGKGTDSDPAPSHTLQTRDETDKMIIDTKIVDDTDSEKHKPKFGEKMMSQMREKLGIGKDPLDENVDPHPEITLDTSNNKTITEKTKDTFGSMFGKAKAMEHESSGISILIKDDSPGPEYTESRKISNVEKLSPFSGPLDGDSAGALENIPPEKTDNVYASDVKAPGVWDRSKEEFQAIGEAIKELVTPKK